MKRLLLLSILCMLVLAGLVYAQSDDTTAPLISAIFTSSGTTSATIIWTTDELATSTVFYGTNSNTNSIASSTTLVTTHSVSLTGLASSTLYFYNVKSCDVAGNCNTSLQSSFITAAASTASSGGGGGGQGGTNQCSYPSKVDCNTKEEADLVLNEWTQGKCNKEASLECIEIWTKSQPQCSQEWKCDGNYKYLQNSDCSISNKEYCQYGCENGACKPYERKECVNGVAYWYKGDSLYETPENCFVQGKICVEGQCVIDPQCTEHMRTDCYDNDVYWFGDCGNGISDKYMECGEAGCSNGKCATTTCTPSWNCDSWSSCTNGKQSRTCTDVNNCGTYSGKPATSQICSVNYNFNDYPLVLIHGLNLCGLYGGNPVSFSNLKNEFKDYYEDKGTFFSTPNCNQLASSTKPIMLSYGYDTSSECFDYIQDFADRFTSFLAKVQECTNAKKVDVIAHSQGGVISRWAIKYDKAKIDKLIMLGTPNKCLGIFDPKKTGLASALQLTSQEFYSKLNDGGETCYNSHCYTIGGDTGKGNDGLVSASCVNLNGAEQNNIVNCNHRELVNPNECPQAFNYITQALGKSTTSSTPTENVVKDKTETLSTQTPTTNTRYCYKRFLGFLWCMEYRYK